MKNSTMRKPFYFLLAFIFIGLTKTFGQLEIGYAINFREKIYWPVVVSQFEKE
jgi:hypothetical protein